MRLCRRALHRARNDHSGGVAKPRRGPATSTSVKDDEDDDAVDNAAAVDLVLPFPVVLSAWKSTSASSTYPSMLPTLPRGGRRTLREHNASRRTRAEYAAGSASVTASKTAATPARIHSGGGGGGVGEGGDWSEDEDDDASEEAEDDDGRPLKGAASEESDIPCEGEE